jgi:hypothetical protein
MAKSLRLLTCFAGLSILSTVHAQHPTGQLEQLVSQLDAPHYIQRQSAFRDLLQRGTSPDDQLANATRLAIKDGLRHPSMEVRLAARELLMQFEMHSAERQLDRLRDPRVPADLVRVDGWESFRLVAGDDMHSRRFFAHLHERYPSGRRQRQLRTEPDPLRLPSEDTLGWAMVLWSDLDAIGRPSARHQRLGILLSQPNLGPEIHSHPDGRVLLRLIGSWLTAAPPPMLPMSQRIRIALRYHQTEIANQFISEVFSERESWPESRITALLAACVLERDDVVQRAMECLDDDRTGCIWNLLAARRGRIRTQVRDVALTVLLQSRGIDPRSAGFDYLEADPFVMFRDHSLGFADEAARTAAHAKGQDLLRRIHVER